MEKTYKITISAKTEHGIKVMGDMLKAMMTVFNSYRKSWSVEIEEE